MTPLQGAGKMPRYQFTSGKPRQSRSNPASFRSLQLDRQQGVFVAGMSAPVVPMSPGLTLLLPSRTGYDVGNISGDSCGGANL